MQGTSIPRQRNGERSELPLIGFVLGTLISALSWAAMAGFAWLALLHH